MISFQCIANSLSHFILFFFILWMWKSKFICTLLMWSWLEFWKRGVKGECSIIEKKTNDYLCWKNIIARWVTAERAKVITHLIKSLTLTRNVSKVSKKFLQFALKNAKTCFYFPWAIKFNSFQRLITEKSRQWLISWTKIWKTFQWKRMWWIFIGKSRIL